MFHSHLHLCIVYPRNGDSAVVFKLALFFFILSEKASDDFQFNTISDFVFAYR